MTHNPDDGSTPDDPPAPGLRRGFMDSDRGISFTVSYIATLAIAAVLIAGVLLAAGQVVSDQREATVRDEATVVGDKVAASTMAADRLVRAGNDTDLTVAVAVELPRRFADTPYVVELTADPEPAVVVRTSSPSLRVSVSMATETPVEPSTATGGPVRIVYRPGDDRDGDGDADGDGVLLLEAADR